MTINVALIGLGVGLQHAEAFTQLTEDFRLHTVCDLQQQRWLEWAGDFPEDFLKPRFVTDLNSILDDGDIDVVDICLPPHLHLDVMLRSLAAGKHVICEKPLVTSLADMDRLEAAAAESGCQVFPVFQYRFGPVASQMNALLEHDLVGKPLVASLETHWDRDQDYYAIPWRGTWAGEQGGAILTHAIHSHDWLSWWMGPVRSVYAQLATRVNPVEVEDCAAISFELECGALATSSVTLGASGDTSRYRFCFSELTVESGLSAYKPAEAPWTFTSRNPENQTAVEQITQAACSSDETLPAGYSGLFKSIARTLAGESRQSHLAEAVTLADARRSIELATAIYASAGAKQVVELPLAESHALYQGWMPV